ncbi:MAG: NAD(P)H-dependent oxidoreductase [Clostridiales bacterium]|nr:NAD(P)H-dependent oxidoreductase [Clostridiales bacterium]
MTLFINACVREQSRTKQLAERLLDRLTDEITQIELSKTRLPKADGEFISWRTEMCARGDFSSPVFDIAKEFARADTVVIAAPYWDLSFPAALKSYLEQVCVVGLTFRYENDRPKGLCRAIKLYYVTTAGGPVVSEEFGFGYVKALAQGFFGIGECVMIKAENLDVRGADEMEIMAGAMAQIDALKL